MNYKVILTSNITYSTYNITSVIKSMRYETNIEEQPDKLSIDLIDFIEVSEGSQIKLYIDDKPIFLGYVFEIEVSRNEDITLTVYNSKRYLKNKSTYILKGYSVNDVFSRVCQDTGLRYTIDETITKTIIPSVILENKTLFEILTYASSQHFFQTGEFLILRDNFGVLTLLNAKNLITNIKISELSSIIDYKFSSSIDKNTYNAVKLENLEKKISAYSSDKNSISKWGYLLYYDKVEEKYNPAQLQMKANIYLNFYNKKNQEISITSLGNINIIAGNGVYVQLESIQNIITNTPYFVTKCTHNFEENTHKMSFELELK